MTFRETTSRLNNRQVAAVVTYEQPRLDVQLGLYVHITSITYPPKQRQVLVEELYRREFT